MDAIVVFSPAPGPNSWTPASDASRVSGWDASDTASITAISGNVTSWADQVASNTFTASGTPRTGDTTQNGLNVIDFLKGSGESFSASVNGFHNSGSALVSVVANITDQDFGGGLVAPDATVGNQDWHLEGTSSGANFNARYTPVNLGGASVVSSGQPFVGWHLYQVVMDFPSNKVRVFVDGIERLDTGYTSAAHDDVILYLFRNKFASTFLSGSVGELWVTADLAARANYATYLTSKWGL